MRAAAVLGVVALVSGPPGAEVEAAEPQLALATEVVVEEVPAEPRPQLRLQLRPRTMLLEKTMDRWQALSVAVAAA